MHSVAARGTHSLLVSNSVLYIFGGYKKGQTYPGDAWMAGLAGLLPETGRAERPSREQQKSPGLKAACGRSSIKPDSKLKSPAKPRLSLTVGPRPSPASKAAVSGRGKRGRSARAAANVEDPSG